MNGEIENIGKIDIKIYFMLKGEKVLKYMAYFEKKNV